MFTASNRSLNDVLWREKMRSDVRTLKLKLIDGEKPKNSLGLTDSRLFTGDNQIHVVRDQWNYWTFKYDKGAVPPVLDASFTTFDKALEHAKAYFKTRNVEVTEVVDNFD